MKPVRYFILLALVFVGIASAGSAGLLSSGSSRRARAYAVSTEIKPLGDRLMAHVELRDLDSNRPVVGVYGFCTIGLPTVFQVPYPGSELRLTVREAGSHTLRYVVELSGVVPEFRYESVISTP